MRGSSGVRPSRKAWTYARSRSIRAELISATDGTVTRDPDVDLVSDVLQEP